MPSHRPRLAVLLCTHNGDRFLTQQLASLANQWMRPVAVFVHDWASTDGTRDLLDQFARENASWLHVEVHLHDHAPGACCSFVSGMADCQRSAVEFDYLALCDQDDIWVPEKLAHYATEIKATATPPALLFSDAQLIDDDGGLICESYYSKASAFCAPVDLTDAALLLTNPVVGMTICVSRRLLSECQLALRGPWLMHDWALVLLAVIGGHRVIYVAKALVQYRQHSRNVLGAPRGLRLLRRIAKATEHFAGIRRQAEWLGEHASRVLGDAGAGIARPGAAQRVHAARASLRSKILQRRSRWLLACGVFIFW